MVNQSLKANDKAYEEHGVCGIVRAIMEEMMMVIAFMSGKICYM